MFQGTPYCTYGDTTNDDRYSPTNPWDQRSRGMTARPSRHKRRCRSEGSTLVSPFTCDGAVAPPAPVTLGALPNGVLHDPMEEVHHREDQPLGRPPVT